MEESKDVKHLKLRLKEAEKNAILAATYGKQLLEENSELHSRLEDTIKEYTLRIEALEQEKHALSLKYERIVKSEQLITNELEQLEEQQVNFSKGKKKYEQEIQKLNKLNSNLALALEKGEMENQAHISHIALLETQMKEAQEKRDLSNVSLQDLSLDESTSALQNEMMALTCKKQELETQVSSLSAQLRGTNLKLSHAEKLVETLNKEVESLECQSTSYFNVLEKNKEEMVELKMEIESLKLAETDPNKKGNSLFAEVEDQRQKMEKQLEETRIQYNILKKQSEIKSQQISKMRIQIANLLSLSRNMADTDYIRNLEESLTSARCQLDALAKHCQDMQVKQKSPSCDPIIVVSKEEDDEKQNMVAFFKGMYLEIQKKSKALEEDLQTARFGKVALSDRILQLQRKLRQTESSRDAANSRVVMLQVKYDELAAKKGEVVDGELGVFNFPVTRVTEKIPGFDGNASGKEETKDDIPLSVEERRAPLKEKSENVLSSESIAAKLEGSCDQPNDLVKALDEKEVFYSADRDKYHEKMLTYVSEKKKPKKSVRMMETVAVQDCNGKVEETLLKHEVEKNKIPKKKIHKKMTAPVVKIENSEEAGECKQQ